MTTQDLSTIKAELTRQGRTLRWLARETGITRSALYAYSCGARTAPDWWIRKARAALGMAEG